MLDVTKILSHDDIVELQKMSKEYSSVTDLGNIKLLVKHHGDFLGSGNIYAAAAIEFLIYNIIQDKKAEPNVLKEAKLSIGKMYQQLEEKGVY